MTTYKQPGEKVPVAMDFTAILPVGETLQGTSEVKVYDSEGTDVTATLLDIKTVVSPKLNAVIKAGTDGEDYKIKFIARTQNYIYEEDMTLKVREG